MSAGMLLAPRIIAFPEFKSFASVSAFAADSAAAMAPDAATVVVSNYSIAAPCLLPVLRQEMGI